MNLTQRVAAAAALLASLSAGASAAYPEDLISAPSTTLSSVGTIQRSQFSSLSMSSFELTPSNSTLTLSSGTLLQSPALTLPSNISAAPAPILGQTPSSVSTPASVNLIPAKPRIALPAYMMRDYRKSPTETAASAR